MVGRGALHEHEHVITSHNFYILTVLSRRICWRVPVTIQLQLQPAASLATCATCALQRHGRREARARAQRRPRERCFISRSISVIASSLPRIYFAHCPRGFARVALPSRHRRGPWSCHCQRPRRAVASQRRGCIASCANVDRMAGKPTYHRAPPVTRAVPTQIAEEHDTVKASRKFARQVS